MVFEKLQSIISDQFSVDADFITMETSFVDDLGADSLDIVELTMAIEEEFDIPETDEDDMTKLSTVGDVVNYVASVLN